MKKYFIYLMAILMSSVLGVSFTSCSSDDMEEPQKEIREEAKDVQVYFVYTLDTSKGSSMTRSSGDDIFNYFYEKITNGEMIVDDYELTLTETTSGLKYTFNSKWSANNMITIRTGNYKVEGRSIVSGGYVQEKCSISIDEVVDITSSSNTITLAANYNCSLLVFNDTNISQVYYFETSDGMTGYKRYFFDYLNYKYAFVNYSFQEKAWIGGEYTNGASFRIYTANLTLEKGKYYVYNSVTNSFNIPKMEQGE